MKPSEETSYLHLQPRNRHFLSVIRYFPIWLVAQSIFYIRRWKSAILSWFVTQGAKVESTTEKGTPQQPFLLEEEESEQQENILEQKKMLIYSQLYSHLPASLLAISQEVYLKNENQYKLISTVYSKYKDLTVSVQLMSALEQIIKGSQGLFQGQEVSSAVIDSYFNELIQGDQNWAAIDSSFGAENQLEKFFTDLASGEKYVSIVNHLRNAQRIFWPICSGATGTQGNHWYLLIIEKNSCQNFNLYGLDGFNLTEVHLHYFQQAKRLLALLFPEQKTTLLQEKTIFIPKQNNFTDCGAVICYWGRQYMQTQYFSWIVDAQLLCDYSQFRYDIAELITLADAKRKLSKCNRSLRA